MVVAENKLVDSGVKLRLGMLLVACGVPTSNYCMLCFACICSVHLIGEMEKVGRCRDVYNRLKKTNKETWGKTMGAVHRRSQDTTAQALVFWDGAVWGMLCQLWTMGAQL